FGGPGPVMLRFRRQRHVMECWVAGQWLQTSASGRDKAAQAAQIDVRRAHPARVYDYWLGGKDNFAADRDAAEWALSRIPQLRDYARGNRQFLARVVRFLCGAGIRQFLDIGSGLPASPNVHDVGQACAPDARV